MEIKITRATTGRRIDFEFFNILQTHTGNTYIFIYQGYLALERLLYACKKKDI
jgi:hypothetical protein